jgi:hypothetical protein
MARAPRGSATCSATCSAGHSADPDGNGRRGRGFLGASRQRAQIGRWLSLLTLLAMFGAVSACTPRHGLTLPGEFARYEHGDTNRWVTAEGVVLRAREVEDPPKATLSFWTEALVHHLERRGYRVSKPVSFRTTGAIDAQRIDAITHRGAEDWLLVTALYVHGERLFLVEATGPWAQLQPMDASLQRALVGFEPAGTAQR